MAVSNRKCTNTFFFLNYKKRSGAGFGSEAPHRPWSPGSIFIIHHCDCAGFHPHAFAAESQDGHHGSRHHVCAPSRKLRGEKRWSVLRKVKISAGRLAN